MLVRGHNRKVVRPHEVLDSTYLKKRATEPFNSFMLFTLQSLESTAPRIGIALRKETNVQIHHAVEPGGQITMCLEQ